MLLSGGKHFFSENTIELAIVELSLLSIQFLAHLIKVVCGVRVS